MLKVKALKTVRVKRKEFVEWYVEWRAEWHNYAKYDLRGD